MALIPVIAMAGQSNADGRADIVNVNLWQTLSYHTSFPQITLFEKRTDNPIDPIIWSTDRGPVSLSARVVGTPGLLGSIGSEMSMCRSIVAAGKSFVLNKCDIGGTGLPTHWLPTSGYPVTPPTLFTQWMDHLETTCVSIGGYIRGVVWIQGENDANDATRAADYQINLTTMINAVRAFHPNCWWIIVKLCDGFSLNFKSQVRTAQEAVAITLPSCYIVNTDDLPFNGVHFTGTGYYTLGLRIADSIINNNLLR